MFLPEAEKEAFCIIKVFTSLSSSHHSMYQSIRLVPTLFCLMSMCWYSIKQYILNITL